MQEITSRKNPIVQHLKRLGTDRTYRDACGEFLCDGIILYEEALQWGAEITYVVASRSDLATGAILVPAELLTYISPLKSPQPILFACKKAPQVPLEGADRVLILDGLQDPGNVGTLIRSASAFYVDQVILTGESADLYNPKTIRGAMGAVFRQRVCRMAVDEILEYVNETKTRDVGDATPYMGITLLGAAAGAGGRDAGGPWPERVAIAIGSEGQGISQALLERCHRTVRIPMNPACESLNAGVAGSILLWEMHRNMAQ
ncbi:MAG: RNA methyltransferase [Oscillospiraceae bacterium]|nr:RNA methyltransferase [Oscillospiraceae bacterium]